nr:MULTISPECIES: hypothetical protein [unclassified Clostridium]
MGVGFVSKCPFWSSKKEKVNCYNECPMYPVSKDDEVCPFIEHLNHNKVSINDFDDFEYSQNNIYDLSYMGIKNYD